MSFHEQSHIYFKKFKNKCKLVFPHRAKRPCQRQHDTGDNAVRLMRNDFEITVPAMDDLVAILQYAIGDQGGARMTGGGFGGAAVAIMPQARVADVQAKIQSAYETPKGDAPLIMVERPGPGVSIL